ncbi:MAG: hypothetical protein LBI53_07110 [Candidatus Peribacteria bacterium]|nr:hypothetical protein [Candidatus Peribacteria bacterium]
MFSQWEKFDIKLRPFFSMQEMNNLMKLSNQSDQFREFYNIAVKDIKLAGEYFSAGEKTIRSSAEINRCVSVFNQGQIYISPVDMCLQAKLNGTLNQWKCDMN